MPEPITRTILERFDVPDSGYETVVMLVEMDPDIHSGLHTHPGYDAAYLLEGGLTVLEQGRPDKPIRPGESWHVPPGSVHKVEIGDQATKVLAIYIVEKGKPLATPWVPQPS